MRILVRCLAAIALVAALVSPALANGRPPLPVKVVFRPGSNSELLVGTTFGFLLSKDDGATWRWLCDSVVGIQGTYDPDYELTSTGLVLATSYDGIYLSRDGCTWTKPAGPLGEGTTSSIAVASNGDIYATLSDPVLGYKVFKSSNDGASWDDLSAGLPATDWWNTIEVAPSDPSRIYLTGFRFNGQNPRSRVLVRSTDGGQTWQELPTTAFVGTNNSDLLIAGVHPTDPDIVYLRMTLTAATLQEKIYRTSNGGAALPAGPTWTQVLVDGDNLTGLTIRGNGDVYVVHTQTQKLSKSTGGAAFALVPGVAYYGTCIAERPGDDVLFMCMKNELGTDGTISHLARSTTGAAGSWTSTLRFIDIAGPLRCPSGIVRDDCELNLWCGTREQLGATSTEIDCSAPVDAGIDANGPATPPKDSCCGAGGGESSVALGSMVLGLLGLRRRRPRQSC